MNILRYPHLLVVALSGLVMLPAQAIAEPEPLQTRFVRDFSSFSGSEANAQSLYTGLKHGTRITLAASSTTTSSGGIATPVVQFDPPTRPMKNGNVFISAALAKQQLANYGISEPTPQQLQAVLTSGTILPPGSTKPVVLKGILLQRADGMGWGSIAKNAGIKLGKMISGVRSGNTVTAARGETVATAAATPTQSRGSMGMRSASRGNSAYAPSQEMVTATARPAGSASNTFAQAGGHGGSVSTSFTTAGGSAISPQGHGKGLIKQ